MHCHRLLALPGRFCRGPLARGFARKWLGVFVAWASLIAAVEKGQAQTEAPATTAPTTPSAVDLLSQPAVDLFPAEAVLLVQVKSGRELAEKIKRSDFGRMLEDPALKPLIGKLGGAVVRAAAVVQERTGKSLDEVLGMFAGEMAAAVVVVKKKPSQLVLLIDFADQAENALSVLTRLEQLLQEKGRIPTRAQMGDLLVKQFPDVGPRGRSVCYAMHRGKLLLSTDIEVFYRVFARGSTVQILEEAQTAAEQALPPVSLPATSPEVPGPAETSAPLSGADLAEAELQQLDAAEGLAPLPGVDDSGLATPNAANTDGKTEPPPPVKRKAPAKFDADDTSYIRLSEFGDFGEIYRMAQGDQGSPPDLLWYCEPIALVRSILENNIAATLALNFLPFTGLDGIRAMGGGIQYESSEFAMANRATLLLESPREGFLKALALEPVEFYAPRWVPNDVIGFTSGRCNPPRVFSGVCSTLDALPGWQQGDSGRMLQKGFDRLELDFQEDLLPLLDGRLMNVNKSTAPGSFTSISNGIALGLKDSGKARTLLSRVLKDADWTQVGQGENRYYAANLPELSGNAPGGAPPNSGRPEPCLAVLGDELVFADRRAAMEAYVQCFNAPEMALSQSLEFKLVQSRIETLSRDRKLVAAGYQSPEQGIRHWYDLAASKQNREFLAGQANTNPFLGDVQQALTEYPLPPFETLLQYCAPGGIMVTDDEVGLHYLDFVMPRKAPGS